MFNNTLEVNKLTHNQRLQLLLFPYKALTRINDGGGDDQETSALFPKKPPPLPTGCKPGVFGELAETQESSSSEISTPPQQDTLPPVLTDQDKPKVLRFILVLFSFLFIMYIFAHSLHQDHKPDVAIRKIKSITSGDLSLFKRLGLGLPSVMFSANSATFPDITPDLQRQCLTGHIPKMLPTCGADGCLKVLKGSPRLAPPINPDTIDIIRRIYGYTSIIHFSVVRHVSQMQWNFGVYGSVGEIGVYEGKFTGMLALHMAPEYDERLFICDTFKDHYHMDQEVKEANVESFEKNMQLLNFSIESSHDPLRIRMWDDSSAYLSKILYIKMEIPAFRLFSIHGSTDPNIILSDLHHVACVIRDGGVVILHHEYDASSNSRNIVAEFISIYGDDILLPFLRVREKLYLSPASWQQKYVSYFDKRGIAEKMNLCKVTSREYGTKVEMYTACPENVEST